MSGFVHLSKVAMRTAAGAKPAFMVSPFSSTSEGLAWIPGYDADTAADTAAGGTAAVAAPAPPPAAAAAAAATGAVVDGGAPRQIVLNAGSLTTSVSLLLRIFSLASLEIFPFQTERVQGCCEEASGRAGGTQKQKMKGKQRKGAALSTEREHGAVR